MTMNDNTENLDASEGFHGAFWLGVLTGGCGVIAVLLAVAAVWL